MNHEDIIMILLMEEVPNNHLGRINSVNSGRNYQPQLVRRILAINSIMKYDAWMCQCEVSVFCIQGKPRDVIPESCLVNKTDPQYDHLHQNKMCVFFCNGNHPNFIPNSKITDS